MSVPQKYAQKPMIFSSGKNRDKSQSKAALIINEKSPSDIIINGKEINFSKGFKIALNSARIKPASNKSFQSRGKEKFGTKYEAIEIARAFPRILTKNLSIFCESKKRLTCFYHSISAFSSQ